MEIELKNIMHKIDKLNLLRHIYYQKISSKTGLYVGQVPILDYVLKNHECTQREIADQLQISPASIAISTKRMQKIGLLQKAVDEDNLRRNKLTITQKGYESLSTCKSELDKLDSQIFENINMEELEQLSVIIDKMISSIISEEFIDKTFESLVELERKLVIQSLKKLEEKKDEHN